MKTQPLGLLFSGQGAQSVGMIKSLCDNSASARSLMDEANNILGFDLKKICFEGPETELTKTSVCQPALFVHGYILYTLLKEAGQLSNLKLAMGNSLGELTALAVAGVFDFSTGLKIVAKRGALMQEACEATSGGMAAIIGGEVAEVKSLCDAFEVDISNVNSPGQTVISGEKSKIEAAIVEAKNRGFKRAIPLIVAGAYHSRLMQPARSAFEAFLAPLPFNTPQITVLTNVTGEAVTSPEVIKQMLCAQITSTVEWVKCMQKAQSLGITHFYECGPGGVLTGLAKRIDGTLSVTSLAEYSDLAGLTAS